MIISAATIKIEKNVNKLILDTLPQFYHKCYGRLYSYIEPRCLKKRTDVIDNIYLPVSMGKPVAIKKNKS